MASEPPATANGPSNLDPLLQRYLPRLHAFVHARLGVALRRRDSTEDIVQSVCRELVAKRDEFEFRGEERFRAWLFTAALNKIRAKARLHHAGRRDLDREVDAIDHGAWGDVANLLTPSVEAVGKETAVIMAAALAQLSEEHREVITLARIVGLPHHVTAEFLERSEDAVRQLLARALVSLAQELRKRGVDVGKSP